MAKIELNEIKEFLHNKPGYLKEGGRRLRDLLREKGFTSTIYGCKQAIREVNAEIKQEQDKLKNGSAKILFYDIETSRNHVWSWRTGYKINITHEQILKERAVICVSYKWAGEEQTYTLAWDEKQNDKFLIEQFVDVLNEADLIVAHNGDNFDIRWLRGRAAHHRIPMLPKYKQYDTMRRAMTLFNLNSYALKYLAKFLGVGDNKISTRSGLWDDVCESNDREALLEMIEYCEKDVVVLEKVYDIIKTYDNPVLHSGVQNGLNKQTSPIDGSIDISHFKKVVTPQGTIKHIMKDNKTGRFFEMSDTNYKKFLTINK